MPMEHDTDTNNEQVFEGHPLWEDYKFTMELIGELTPRSEAGDPEITARLDLLDDIKTDLATQMARDKEVSSLREGDPIWLEFQAKWRDLRLARSDERKDDEKALWDEIKALGQKIDAQEQLRNSFSTS